MFGEMIIETPAKGSITTSLACLKCPLLIYDRDFIVDLICLPLRGLDVILGMNWLECNYVHINCYNKSVRFSTVEEEEAILVSPKQLWQLLKEEAVLASKQAADVMKSKYLLLIEKQQKKIECLTKNR